MRAAKRSPPASARRIRVAGSPGGHERMFVRLVFAGYSARARNAVSTCCHVLDGMRRAKELGLARRGRVRPTRSPEVDEPELDMGNRADQVQLTDECSVGFGPDGGCQRPDRLPAPSRDARLPSKRDPRFGVRQDPAVHSRIDEAACRPVCGEKRLDDGHDADEFAGAGSCGSEVGRSRECGDDSAADARPQQHGVCPVASRRYTPGMTRAQMRCVDQADGDRLATGARAAEGAFNPDSVARADAQSRGRVVLCAGPVRAALTVRAQIPRGSPTAGRATPPSSLPGTSPGLPVVAGASAGIMYVRVVTFPATS